MPLHHENITKDHHRTHIKDSISKQALDKEKQNTQRDTDIISKFLKDEYSQRVAVDYSVCTLYMWSI